MFRLRHLVLPGVLLIAGYFAVFGGEYSYAELRRTRAAQKSEQAELAALRQEIDSLKAWADSMEVDSATLEKLARERFGMILDGETLYRIVEMDSTEADSSGVERP